MRPVTRGMSTSEFANRIKCTCEEREALMKTKFKQLGTLCDWVNMLNGSRQDKVKKLVAFNGLGYCTAVKIVRSLELAEPLDM